MRSQNKTGHIPTYPNKVYNNVVIMAMFFQKCVWHFQAESWKEHFGEQTDNHQWPIKAWLDESISKFILSKIQKSVFNLKSVTKGHQEWSLDIEKTISWM